MFEEIKKAILEGEEEITRDLVQKAIDAGIAPLDILNEACIPGVERAGELFEAEEFYLPELITAGEATRAAMDIIVPALQSSNTEWKRVGKVVIGTVEGDMHDIGKSIVSSMLTATGFDVIDLGIDVSTDRFVEEVLKEVPGILGLSALLTSTMKRQQDIIEALVEAGLKDKVKVLVGGAPVTQEWAERIGADGYAEDAVAAVKLAKSIVS
jgi:corrinoid protein of di/trimethylamine methyltransferase